jgi:hypothetical protein
MQCNGLKFKGIKVHDPKIFEEEKITLSSNVGKQLLKNVLSHQRNTATSSTLLIKNVAQNQI